MTSDPQVPAPALWLRWGVWVAFGVLVLLLLAPAGPFARFVDTSATWLDYPYARPGSEGLILYESLLVKRGVDIYSPITAERFISGPYPPLFYRVAAWVLPSRLPDLGVPGAIDSIFRNGRAISLLATLLAAALVALLVIFEGGYNRHGWRTLVPAALGATVGGTLLLTMPQVIVWATRFRGDMLMIALTAAGLVCVALGTQRSRVTWRSPLLLAAAGLFVFAFFTKQTALAGPAASAVYLLLRDWRVGLRWCVVLLLAVAVPFAILDLANGHWFYLKMIVYHSLPFSGLTFTRLLHYAFWDEEWPLILVAVGYALYGLGQWIAARRTAAARDVPLLIPLFVLASLATLPTGAVVGADHNHLLMPGLALSAAAGALLAMALVAATNPARAPKSAFDPLLLASLAAILVLMGYVVFTSAPSTVAYGPDLAQPSAAEQEQLRKIAFYLRQSPGTLFYADDAGVLALAGKDTPYDDPFTMSALAAQGRWDESTLRTMLRQGKFGLLVLSCDVMATLDQQEGRKRGENL
ncbi:MAG: ArnT family glycosyltransferase, partial [Chloroflexia bacterium]